MYYTQCYYTGHGASDLDQRWLNTRHTAQGSASVWSEWLPGVKPPKLNFCFEMQQDHAEMQKWPTTEPEDYMRYLNQIWHRAEQTDSHHDGPCQIHLSWKSKIGSDHIEFRKMKIYPWNLMDRCITTTWRWSQVSDNIINNSKTALSVHVLDNFSDDYNF